jgi:hypothetical protein
MLDTFGLLCFDIWICSGIRNWNFGLGQGIASAREMGPRNNKGARETVPQFQGRRTNQPRRQPQNVIILLRFTLQFYDYSSATGLQ